MENHRKSQKLLEEDQISLSKGCDGSITVSIRLVCGGQHTVTFKDGHSDLRRQSFSFSVSGLPKCGDMVKNGPDHIMDEDFEGTVQNAQMHYKKQAHIHDPYRRRRYYNQQPARIADGYSVHVAKANGEFVKYRWGQDGIYDIELV